MKEKRRKENSYQNAIKKQIPQIPSNFPQHNAIDRHSYTRIERPVGTHRRIKWMEKKEGRGERGPRGE